MATGANGAVELLRDNNSLQLREAREIKVGDMIIDAGKSNAMFVVTRVKNLFGPSSVVILEGQGITNAYRSLTLNRTDQVYILT